MSNEFKNWLQHATYLDWPILKVLRFHDEIGRAYYRAYNKAWDCIIESYEWMEIVDYGRTQHYQLKPCWKAGGRAKGNPTTQTTPQPTTPTPTTSGRAGKGQPYTQTTPQPTTPTPTTSGRAGKGQPYTAPATNIRSNSHAGSMVPVFLEILENTRFLKTYKLDELLEKTSIRRAALKQAAKDFFKTPATAKDMLAITGAKAYLL